MTDQHPVEYDVTDGVATITLNRPEAMNSLDIATKEALRDIVIEAAEDPTVRCVVLTGSGRAFCVGQDLKEHVQLLESGSSEELFTTVERHYNPTVTALATMGKPVIAALNGVAAGAGASLAFACDLRVLAESAGFNLAFPGVALSCDTGASWTLPRLVGRAKAMELLYFPSTVPAEKALELGLATSVVPDDQLGAEVTALATRLANGPTLSYASMRQSVNFSSTHDLPESLVFEAEKMSFTGSSEDHRNAVSAFVAKEKPTFHAR
jgi:2-(1,2-epoxy-1,2-dihydrophenyl)acetyl-CoA isomerase